MPTFARKTAANSTAVADKYLLGRKQVGQVHEAKSSSWQRAGASTDPAPFRWGFSRIHVLPPTPLVHHRQPSLAKADDGVGGAEEAMAMPVEPEPLERSPIPEEAQGGRVPDVITVPGEGRETSGEDTPANVTTRDVETPRGRGNVIGDIQLNFRQPRTLRSRFGKHDPVVPGVTTGAFSQPSGKVVSPFGAESYEPAFKNISFAFASSKCTITATLDVVCPWGTNPGTDPAGNPRTDVPSATAAVVTKGDWPAIKADLMPGVASPHKSPRSKYYSQTLVERHEKFHGTEDNKWTSASGLGIVKTHLEAGTVAPGAGAGAAVTALVAGARTKLVSENLAWYKGGGASHGAFAGEIAAYADGKDEYKKLADGVEAHGKTLP